MQLWKKMKDLKVTGKLALGKGAVVTVTDPNGIETNLNPFVKALITTYTVPESENGMTYTLNLAGGFAVTLPAPKIGLRYTFIAGISPTTAYTVVTAASANIMKGFATNAAGALVTPLSAGDTITFVANQAVAGDQVTVVSDGTSWFMTGWAQVAAGVTITQAS